MSALFRDLAARNVLVEDPKRIRISDFGLSKLLDADKDEQDYQADDSKLPIRWLAKECLTGRKSFLSASKIEFFKVHIIITAKRDWQA